MINHVAYTSRNSLGLFYNASHIHVHYLLSDDIAPNLVVHLRHTQLGKYEFPVLSLAKMPRRRLYQIQWMMHHSCYRCVIMHPPRRQAAIRSEVPRRKK
jgi:hypothetical protein